MKIHSFPLQHENTFIPIRWIKSYARFACTCITAILLMANISCADESKVSIAETQLYIFRRTVIDVIDTLHEEKYDADKRSKILTLLLKNELATASDKIKNLEKHLTEMFETAGALGTQKIFESSASPYEKRIHAPKKTGGDALNGQLDIPFMERIFATSGSTDDKIKLDEIHNRTTAESLAKDLNEWLKMITADSPTLEASKQRQVEKTIERIRLDHAIINKALVQAVREK